jgi:hypothetical protein
VERRERAKLGQRAQDRVVLWLSAVPLRVPTLNYLALDPASCQGSSSPSPHYQGAIAIGARGTVTMLKQKLKAQNKTVQAANEAHSA